MSTSATRTRGPSQTRASGGALRPRAAAWACALALAGGTLPASAYVVVTSDNNVFEVPTKPEVRGELVHFSLDGTPVSLRVYDVNVAKTNELNFLADRGGDAASAAQQIRAMDTAPADDRLIVSSRVHREAADAALKESSAYRIVRQGTQAPMYSFSSDVPGPRTPAGTRMSFTDSPGRKQASTPTEAPPPASRSPFESEARQAMRDAEQRVAADKPSPPPAPDRDAVRRSERGAELDSEIAAEQAYLRKLTAGEVVVDDLDKEINRSMDKVRKLQAQRAKLGDTASVESPAAPGRQAPYQPTGSYPEGSREAKWERELVEAEGRLDRLQKQQASVSGGDKDEREMVGELIGETQWKIDRLKKKLAKGGT